MNAKLMMYIEELRGDLEYQLWCDHCRTFLWLLEENQSRKVDKLALAVVERSLSLPLSDEEAPKMK
jgi:hypothetical protein